MKGQTARPLRYEPVEGGFRSRGAVEFFNRPLYGPNNAFRVDCGDLPEFSLYLPGHGGNLRLGVRRGETARWLFEAATVHAVYRSGHMVYQIQDPLLGEGRLRVTALTAAVGSGLLVRVEALGVPEGAELTWAFGGVSGRKGKRGGDIGCEVEPVSRFFQVRPEECRGNTYMVDGARARVQAKAAELAFSGPAGSRLWVSDAGHWGAGWMGLRGAVGETAELPVLIGSVGLAAGAVCLSIARMPVTAGEPEAEFAARLAGLERVAGRVVVETPDGFVNCVGGALGIAGDALWDEAQGCVMHGAVAWRNPLAGWRGPYVLDAVGWHERFRQHARHWIGRQNRSPVTSGDPAMGRPDPGSHLARTENLLHSNGDLSHNHYDMNLVFFDAVLRHLRWTGDLEFAREIWPALEAHLAWERRLFRRMYRAASGMELPLYEAYACIWASDNLQYNGGGAAHASAYNYFANREAARLARMLGEDAALYEAESDAILTGMRELLWLPGQGAFGESKDLLGPQTVYASPALWTVYHTIDSEVTRPREAWQMAAERLGALRAVPVEGAVVPGGGYMLSCSDWMPYEWSLNLLLLAENMHMALALWQAGMVEEANGLFQGNVVDSMFQGLCPGNFHMTSELDAHRQEAQRDFGDPIGITARALVEGLFGVTPDLLEGRLRVRPGFPARWDRARLEHPEFTVAWRRVGEVDRYEVTSLFARPVRLELALRAPRSGVARVIVNGRTAEGVFDPEAVGAPLLRVEAEAAKSWVVEVQWRGTVVEAVPARRVCGLGDRIIAGGAEVDDPQGCLREGRVAAAGVHTVFVRRRHGACAWWHPVTFEARVPVRAAARLTQATGRMETVDLAGVMTGRITEIFARSYDEPRSPYCSLSIPENGIGGWATFDRRPVIDDSGLRGLGDKLTTPEGLEFRLPAGANCVFLSYWKMDRPLVRVPLAGRAKGLALLMAGSTFPQASRMTHAEVVVRYADGTEARMELRNPETWWPIEQDYLIDDYLFVDGTQPPVRVDLKTGAVRRLELEGFKGRGRVVDGGAANIVEMALDASKTLASVEVEVKLYGVVVGLMGVTLVR
jgi:hypothetical protein